MMKNTVRRMCVAAGLLVGGVAAHAISDNAQIMIDRALNSPTLTVRYSGAHAALVELRVNGESLGTRTVVATKSAGETNFTLNLSDLKDGDNDVEIRLFDRTGKLVGSDHSSISTEQTLNAPVYLTTPKVGQTVNGMVDIKLGFGQTLKDIYVSFFVDNDWKSMSNVPPYQYSWDSTLEKNGWHELEAWAIDGHSSTFKTKKVKVFVDNPHGDTPRYGVDTEPSISTNPSQVDIQDTNSHASIRHAQTRTGQMANGGAVSGIAPALRGGHTSRNTVHAEIAGSMVGAKDIVAPVAMPTGVRELLPTGKRIATVTEHAGPVHATIHSTLGTGGKVNDASIGTIEITRHHDTVAQIGSKVPSASVIRTIENTANLIEITRGQHIPNLGSFAVVLNSQFVDFDVPTRVDGGVPMAPFRHLIEKSGGLVDWDNMTKSVNAQADGRNIFLQIGDKNAKINNSSISLDLAPYIDRGRTIVPISFMKDALNVNVEYDKTTGHVLITSNKK